jgi:tripartite-type tricarboxylate transporter receptor subunit TctC
VVRIVAVRCALAACAAAVVLSALPALGADAYPTRPIRIIVPFTPGTLDVLARSIGQKLTEKYGQTIVVENRPGAGTIVGTDILAKSTPDGYTLEMITTTFVINPSLYKKLPYDPLRDFAPITQLDTVANILVVNPSMPANSLKELIALAKSKPGQLTYASPGSGSAPHIATELLKSMAGIDMVHVPYKGIPEAATDVIANRVTMLMTTTASAATFIKAGRLRALAVSSRKRVAAMPDIPTVGETLPGYVADAFRGVIAPAGVSKPVINQLAADIAAALKQPDVHDRLINDGSDPVGSTPEAFAAFLRSEMLKWGKVVKESGARPD